jgi:hypothetical protein
VHGITGHNFETLMMIQTFHPPFFSSPDPKGYCHHLASVVVVRQSSVVRRKLFQKSSPLKVQDQWFRKFDEKREITPK